jgi:MoaA/NifB/PqqE/SkfB family radical SAM enzyme
MDIIGTCNESCEFCYQDNDGTTLSEEEVIGIADANPDLDVVEIGGGEPFLHDGLARIVSVLLGTGRKVHLSTNGTMISEELVDSVSGLNDGLELQVSLHAADPKTYQDITGKDYFDLVMHNLAKLSSAFRTSISTTVYQRNYCSVEGVIDIASGLGLPVRVLPVLPIGKGAAVGLLEPAQLDKLRGMLLAESLQRGIVVDSPLIHRNNCQALEDAYGIPKQARCPLDLGQKVYYSPRGERYSCEFCRYDVLGERR